MKVAILDFLRSVSFENAVENMFGFELISVSECQSAMLKFRNYRKPNNSTYWFKLLTIDIFDPMSYYVNITYSEKDIPNRLYQFIIIPDYLTYETQIAIAAKLIVYVHTGQNCHQDITSVQDLLQKAKLKKIQVERTNVQKLAKRYQVLENFTPWHITKQYPKLHVANQNEFNLVKYTNRNDSLYHRYYWNPHKETHYFQFGDSEAKPELLKMKYRRDKQSKSHYFCKNYKNPYDHKMHIRRKMTEVEDYLYDVKHGFA
jgi:hypothetical protein